MVITITLCQLYKDTGRQSLAWHFNRRLGANTMPTIGVVPLIPAIHLRGHGVRLCGHLRGHGVRLCGHLRGHGVRLCGHLRGHGVRLCGHSIVEVCIAGKNNLLWRRGIILIHLMCVIVVVWLQKWVRVLLRRSKSYVRWSWTSDCRT